MNQDKMAKADAVKIVRELSVLLNVNPGDVPRTLKRLKKESEME